MLLRGPQVRFPRSHRAPTPRAPRASFQRRLPVMRYVCADHPATPSNRTADGKVRRRLLAEASAAYQKALSIDGSDGRGYMGAAKLLEKENRTEEARAMFEVRFRGAHTRAMSPARLLTPPSKHSSRPTPPACPPRPAPSPATSLETFAPSPTALPGGLSRDERGERLPLAGVGRPRRARGQRRPRPRAL